MIAEIEKNSKKVILELIEKAQLTSGDTLVIGCSSSEVVGGVIGKNSSFDIAKAIVDAILPVLNDKGINLAAQCCEHLNRALVINKPVATSNRLEIVNVRPMPKAGGSFATAVFEALPSPCVVEEIKADAGLDIGNTLIGMHLKAVAVPIRLENNRIGSAPITAAYTRPKYIGGSRAVYSD